MRPLLPSALRLERLRRGLTQEAVAQAIRADQTTVSLCERGHRLAGSTFQRLAAYYACSPEALNRRMVSWRRRVAMQLAEQGRRVA